MLHNGVELATAETYVRKYLTQTKEPEVAHLHRRSLHRSLTTLYEEEGV